MAVGYNPRIVIDGLVLALDAGNTKSYPGIGTAWTDMVSSGIGTLTNGPTFDSGNGGSIVFDGTDDYVITGTTLPDADELFADTGNAWSTSSWFNVDDLDPLFQSVAARGGGVGTSAVYSVWVKDTGEIRTRLRGGTPTTIGNSIAVNTWYNVAITWDGTTANAYLNGKFITTIAVGTVSFRTGDVGIGIGGENLDRSPFDGKISQTLAYNKALAVAEISQNFNAIRGRFGI